MDDLGNILYLVLIIGFSLIGFFKSKKKNIEPELVLNEIDEDNVKELLRKLAREEEKGRKITPPQIKKQEFKRESLRKDEKKNQAIEKTSDEKALSQEFNIESLDDARKAFVYSEIFQRKY